MYAKSHPVFVYIGHLCYNHINKQTFSKRVKNVWYIWLSNVNKRASNHFKLQSTKLATSPIGTSNKSQFNIFQIRLVGDFGNQLLKLNYFKSTRLLILYPMPICAARYFLWQLISLCCHSSASPASQQLRNRKLSLLLETSITF